VSWSIGIKASAQKALAIDRLRETPYAGGVLKGEFSGLRRLRVGRYRVVYEVIESRVTILVVRIAHRREVYR
jgi:mRNA interferase RelE/StbE